MKPTLILGGNGCNTCDGYGIMTLYAGPNNSMIAPCLKCSPDKSLFDLQSRKLKAINAYELAKEKELIRAHNERIMQ